jgi:uncharacterized protein
MTRIVIDTGPLVAYFNGRDKWHKWVVEQMQSFTAPLLTCEPVLTEACFLIHRAGGRAADLIRKVNHGVLEIAMGLSTESETIETLLKRYEDTPMSLADACLVRISERIPDCRLFTLDSDFEHYRRNGRQLIPLLKPNQSPLVLAG